MAGGVNPETKKAQLKELLTRYGPIEFWRMDHATGTGGLSHADTVEWIHKFQPNSFVGFNHGEPARSMWKSVVPQPMSLRGGCCSPMQRRHHGLLPMSSTARSV